ncbi:MAG: VWA domain-containing protein [Bryobacterales bacterium]|nr:VWA domain-containing protein [Bryobacterales bacterium]
MRRLLLVTWAAFGSPLLAQDDAVFRVESSLVTVPVQVSALDGSAVPALGREDFTLLDEGVPTPLAALWRETDLPLTLGLVMDTSGSQTERLAAHRATLSAFLARLLRPRDRAFLVSVGMDPRLVTPLTASREMLEAGLARLAADPHAGTVLGEPCRKTAFRDLVMSQCGGTALWNAVWAAARHAMPAEAGRRALLILSDGIDTGSTHTLPQTSAELHRTGVVAYAIQYPRPSRRSSVGLQRLAEETGGLRFLPPEGSYEPLFARLEDDLRSQYVLGFRPAADAAPAGFRRLEVRVTGEGHGLLRVRARAGYVK